MPTTTIKVDSAIRDRLAHLARARGTTMSALLSDVAARLETEQRWSDIEVVYERMQREDPDGWAEYLGELAEWEAGTATTDTAAAQELPPKSSRSTTSEGGARSGLVSNVEPS